MRIERRPQITEKNLKEYSEEKKCIQPLRRIRGKYPSPITTGNKKCVVIVADRLRRMASSNQNPNLPN